VKETGLVQGAIVDGLRVAVVDDEPIARSRLSRLLSRVGGPSVKVVLECGTTDEFLAVGPKTALDAAFVDVEMPGGDGLDAVTRWPGLRPQFIIVTAHGEHALRAFDARAIDYLTKPVSESRLRDSLDRAHAYRSRSLIGHSQTASAALSDVALTSRQVEILRLVSDQRSNKEIGRALELSHFTVRNHLSALYRLFGVNGRHDLMVRASAAGGLRPARMTAVEGGGGDQWVGNN
jgi:DNA-binding NarL/FixJ family response regulator